MALAAAVLNASATAQAARPVIAVVDELPPGGAVGLYVPGAGGTISREGAIAALRRGKVENALLGGTPPGPLLVDLANGGASPPAVYVTLPPPGKHSNTKRYLVGVYAPGFTGILTSDSTHIDGLVSIPDITQTAIALANGGQPDIRDVAGDERSLRKLDQRLARIHPDRGWVLAAVVLTMLALALFAPRLAVLGGAAAVTASLLLSWWGATRLWVVVLGMVALTVALAAVPRRLIPLAMTVFFVAFLLVLTLAPETSSLAVLGARPDGGGRFYGITNQVETLLLAPLLAALAVGGLRWLVPLGALALVTIGWSGAGADGGGLIVVAVALAVFVLRSSRAAPTWRRAAVAAAGVVAVLAVVIGLDAWLGGSSHVTDAVGTGPGSLLGDLGRRLHLSWGLLTKDLHNVLLFLLSLTVVVWIATRRPRHPSVDAMLAALAVSLLVNDTPVDVLGLGTLGCLALLRFESVDSRPMRRGALTVACALAVLALAGCGDEGVVSPLPGTVVGTVQAEAPGKAIFVNQGCGSCHTYAPAGPDAKGNIGPDLDDLAADAKRANQPLAAFARESIINPDAYIEKGYPKGVMPKSYSTLPPDQLQALVDFLTKPQG